MARPVGPSSVAAAIDWLQPYHNNTGLAPTPGAPRCPLLTAAVVPALLAFGERALALRWIEWLLSTQRADGSFPRSAAGDRSGSLSVTAQAIGALMALDEANLRASALHGGASCAERAAAWLASRVDAAGRFELSDLPPTSIDRWAAPAIHVACLPALRQASRRFGVPAWEWAVERAADHLRRSADWACFHQPAVMHAMASDAWISLGESDLAREAMRWPAAAQHRNGAVPAEPGGRWFCSAALAHFAVVWYKLADRPRADRALACLQSRQLPTGGFADGWSPGRRSSHRASAWTWKRFLEASLAQVQTSFEQGAADLRDRIDPLDGRFRAIRQACDSLGPAPKIADVGCGSGRFLRELAPLLPAARLIAIDPSQAALERCLAAAERRRGSLLNIPADDGEFDGVLAVESLEHALLPEQAVRELCRVVRPGGRIVVIDKHRAKQRLSEHDPWEQWFLPETVSAWLARDCRSVHARPIAHGPACQPDGLFWCWQATR